MTAQSTVRHTLSLDETLRKLPEEAMLGVVNDTTQSKPPPLWVPAFAGTTVERRSLDGKVLEPTPD